MTTRAALRRFHARLSLIGPPGSGKGSYGRILAQHWNIPLVTVSDVLKQRNCQDIHSHTSSGKLIDDEVVSEALMEHFEELLNSEQKGKCGYILDGFPRTLEQVHLMERTWPGFCQIQAAVHLDVPPEVCETKLLGRRICSICGGHFNVNAVHWGGFDLPPKLPRPGECHRSTSAPLPQQHHLARCDPDIHWKKREDDERHIVHQRLEVYLQNSQPILEHFKRKQALFQFTPYKGFNDMTKLQSKLEEWLLQNLPESIETNDS